MLALRHTTGLNRAMSAYMLQPSTIESAGVGCFATEQISQGTPLRPATSPAPCRRLEITEIPDSHLKYCPLLESGLYLAPADFAVMSVFWYINHARQPNVATEQWRLYAAATIEPGEELFMYYPDLLTHPKNAEWVIPELHV